MITKTVTREFYILDIKIIHKRHIRMLLKKYKQITDEVVNYKRFHVGIPELVCWRNQQPLSLIVEQCRSIFS
jgi:hypothetical protein